MAVTREDIEAERAAWPAAGRARVAPHPVSPALRLVRGGGSEAARAWSPADYGHPSVLGRLRAADRSHPIEVRVWARRPASCADAVYHPSGVWIAIRLLD